MRLTKPRLELAIQKKFVVSRRLKNLIKLDFNPNIFFLAAKFSQIEDEMQKEEGSFVNSVYTKIFSDMSKEDKCKTKVSQLAFVEIRFPESGGLEITRSPALSLSSLVATIGESKY